MKKQNIVKKNELFTRAIEGRKVYKNNAYVIYIYEREDENYRFGVSVGKKIGAAVTRNKYKRQIRMIIDKYKKNYQNNLDYIIIIRNGYIGLDFKEKEEKFNELIYKINRSIKKEKIE